MSGEILLYWAGIDLFSYTLKYFTQDLNFFGRVIKSSSKKMQQNE